jgi:PAS domain S-box-containing protein
MLVEPTRNPHERASLESERLERAEHALWRNSIVLLVVFGVGMAVGLWTLLRASSPRWEVLPVGILIFAALFAFYTWRKKRQIHELRELLHGLHESGSTLPGNAQVGKLLEIVSHSQRGYRDLIDTLDHAVFTLSPDGALRVANLYMAQVFGVPFQELIGHGLDEFFADPSPEQARAALAGLLKSGGWVGRIPVRLKKSSELRYFDCRFQVLRTEGQLVGISGWAHDVTAQHESEVRFAELFESLREGIFFTTPEGQVLDANPALVRMLGYDSKQELQARNFRDVYVNPAERDEIVRELRDRGSVQDRELRLVRKDGARIQCIGSGVAIRDMFGRLVRLQGTFVDITDRVQMEKLLHQEQELFRRLVASFPDIIAVLDCAGRYTFVSPRIQEVLGGRPQEYVGESIGARAHPEDHPKLLEMFEATVGGKSPYSQIEFRSKGADGSWRTLRASAAPLFDAGGKVNGVVACARDVTASKQSEAEAAQKERLASMGQMMAGVAHELNNPLTAILGVSDLLRERAGDDSTRRHVEIVLKQARRAAAIIQNLLAFSRPATAGRAKVRVDEVVRQALQSQQASLTQKNISVDFQSPVDLPVVQGDPKLLEQVFSNLLINAEQAIASVRDRGTIRISLASLGGKVSVTFLDDGPGIDSENMRKIFDPFFTTKRPGGGTGLGLTICLALVKEHGGSIEVQSMPGCGASFQVLLPTAEAQSAQLQPNRASTAASVARSPEASVLRGHSVLVVDDEDSIREIVQEGLTARGMAVEGAASAEDALAHLATASYEVLLCDFNLPGLNGDQLFERLRAEAHAAPPRFVFMTGDLLDPAVIEAFSRKGASVLQKPFHVSGLATLLAELLQMQPAKM